LVVVVLGAGVYDRLAELGYAAFGRAIVDGVHFGNKPIEPPSLDETGKLSGGPRIVALRCGTI